MWIWLNILQKGAGDVVSHTRVLYCATLGSSLELVATNNFQLTTKILDCYGEVNHVNWWVHTTKEMLGTHG